MLKKLLSLCLAVLFLVPVSAETFSYSGGSASASTSQRYKGLPHS